MSYLRYFKSNVWLALGFVLVIVLGLIFFGCATAPVVTEPARPTYTYEGELDPKELTDETKWLMIQASYPPDYLDNVVSVMKNIGSTSLISFMLVRVDYSQWTEEGKPLLTGYAYYKENKLFVYVYFKANGQHYRRLEQKYVDLHRRHIDRWLKPHLGREI